MKTYAYIQDGTVAEIIPPMTYDADIIGDDGRTVLHEKGSDIAIEDRYTPDFVEALIDISNVLPDPQQGWTYDGSTFAAPVPYQPSPAEIVAGNTATRDALLSDASTAIAPLQMAVSLGEATDAETASAKAWVAYARALKGIDVTQSMPDWPEQPTTSA